MAQIALALDTTTEVLELAIAQVHPLTYLKSQEWLLGRELSVQIHPCLAEFMYGYRWNDLAFVAIACGVGSFTSTRIGVVLARTLGEQLGIPVYGISSNDLKNLNHSLDVQAVDKYSLQPSSAKNLLKLGQSYWATGKYSHWSQVLPLYA
jgi:tRNA threonylcarbamoyladenosine biosynthesis protein TsaB